MKLANKKTIFASLVFFVSASLSASSIKEVANNLNGCVRAANSDDLLSERGISELTKRIDDAGKSINALGVITQDNCTQGEVEILQKAFEGFKRKFDPLFGSFFSTLNQPLGNQISLITLFDRCKFFDVLKFLMQSINETFMQVNNCGAHDVIASIRKFLLSVETDQPRRTLKNDDPLWFLCESKSERVTVLPSPVKVIAEKLNNCASISNEQSLAAENLEQFREKIKETMQQIGVSSGLIMQGNMGKEDSDALQQAMNCFRTKFKPILERILNLVQSDKAQDNQEFCRLQKRLIPVLQFLSIVIRENLVPQVRIIDAELALFIEDNEIIQPFLKAQQDVCNKKIEEASRKRGVGIRNCKYDFLSSGQAFCEERERLEKIKKEEQRAFAQEPSLRNCLKKNNKQERGKKKRAVIDVESSPLRKVSSELSCESPDFEPIMSNKDGIGAKLTPIYSSVPTESSYDQAYSVVEENDRIE